MPGSLAVLSLPVAAVREEVPRRALASIRRRDHSPARRQTRKIRTNRLTSCPFKCPAGLHQVILLKYHIERRRPGRHLSVNHA
ncbi:hypothetical protein BCR44DRAFT_368987 [Catenaria anguillulae PL171]|uniref:Uncharacterized protein n=1 Tax=Catenaria anguillulae PL171 TaxID=765915 RepID=A0A1Y2I1T2_9FUNG|nr:hypothetical protein BCR44DRAFT_368987 [Catenaria anguillulae PL171]